MKRICSTDRCLEHHGFKQPRLRAETHQGNAGKGGRHLWVATARNRTVRVEDIIAEPPAFYSLPPKHHRHEKSTTMPPRISEDITRWVQVVRETPNVENCPRFVRAPDVETCEDWSQPNRYPNMGHLPEHRAPESLPRRTQPTSHANSSSP